MRQYAFLCALGQIGVVKAAAAAAGMSARSVYALRKRPDAESFAAAWDRALDTGHGIALSTAIERALHGAATPVFYRGLQVGERRTHDSRLLLAALRVMRPTVDTASAGIDPPQFDAPGA